MDRTLFSESVTHTFGVEISGDDLLYLNRPIHIVVNGEIPL